MADVYSIAERLYGNKVYSPYGQYTVHTLAVGAETVAGGT